ncbi:MAG TPA: YopX family protein [Ruminiclostridium sp.]
MREIKFRGKRADNSEWVYGSYVKVLSDDNKFEHKIITIFGEVFFVIPETIGQFTGFRDKNDVEIFEGDILHSWGGEYCQGFWEHDLRTSIINIATDCFMLDEFEYIEIIGNIHEVVI